MGTPATKALTQARIAYTEHHYEYEEHGGTRVSSRELGVPEHQVVKTLVMEDERGEPFIVLMHGTMKVDAKALAKVIGAKKVGPCKPETAHKHSGYLVGGTSPFGTRKKMPIYMQRSILELERLYINGGRRGYLVGIQPQDVERFLQATLVEVGVSLSD
jgi:Cys-tRNA(Pro) deacylase